MSESLSDLSCLFTPPESTSPLPPEEERPPSSPLPSKTRNVFYIEPPSLSSPEKKEYKSIPEEFVASGVQFNAPDIERIMGEHRDEGVLFYYARFHDGIAHRVCAKTVLGRVLVSF
jgi:chromodomain-helicase-DNA-binding protein 4